MSPIVLSLTSPQAKSQVPVKLSSSQHCETTVGMKNLADKIALRLYSETPLYGHPLNTVTPVLRTISLVPTKTLYIFS